MRIEGRRQRPAVAHPPADAAAALRLLLADAEGGTRAMKLDGIPAGGNEGEPRGRYLRPGIAVDHEGGRLFVVAAHGLLVAEVGPASGEVTYHSLGASAAKGNIGPGHCM